MNRGSILARVVPEAKSCLTTENKPRENWILDVDLGQKGLAQELHFLIYAARVSDLCPFACRGVEPLAHFVLGVTLPHQAPESPSQRRRLDFLANSLAKAEQFSEEHR